MTHFNPVQLAVAILLLCLCACLNEPTESSPAYLPMDDSEYPYANLPRIVIETEDFAGIRDRETEFPSHLQIYGKDAPESEVYELTVRGRGNSSFKMPKYGMKLEFKDKVSLFGMPKSRDWALIANFGDKSHLRNYMAMRLSEWLDMPYTPRCTFVEVYLNRKYMGLYLLSETVKVAKNRVNIEANDTTFLFEKESDKKIDSPFIEQVRGRGLLNAIVTKPVNGKTAWDICIHMMKKGLLAKPTHDHIIRFAPPLCINEQQLREAIAIIKETFDEMS